ncbi:MAG: outer membrane lipoprotein chaperone LolA [Acidobacteriota bacterium]|nr:outer membrane lipoprotein chaperone LolA [Acidobacteriota bacterium]
MSLHVIPGLAVALTLVAGPAVPVSPRSADASTVATALQRKYDTVHDFSADFTHSYTGGILGKTVTEHGRVYVKKPGLMRWEYAAPNKKLFVSDGVKIYSYIPADRQVIVSSVPPADQATTPTLFLAGKGDLNRDFVATLVDWPGTPPEAEALKLVPRHPQRDYDWLILVVGRQSLQIRRLVTRDAQGGTSSITFTDVKENVGMPDRLFTFKIPRGVDVVTDNPQR